MLVLDTWLRTSDTSAPLNSMVPPPWLVSWIGAGPLPGCTNPLIPICPFPVLLRFAGLGWVLLSILGVSGGDLRPLSFFLLVALSHLCLLYLMLQSTPASVWELFSLPPRPGPSQRPCLPPRPPRPAGLHLPRPPRPGSNLGPWFRPHCPLPISWLWYCIISVDLGGTGHSGSLSSCPFALRRFLQSVSVTSPRFCEAAVQGELLLPLARVGSSSPFIRELLQSQTVAPNGSVRCALALFRRAIGR